MTAPNPDSDDQVIVARAYTVEGALDATSRLAAHGITANCGEPGLATYIWVGTDLTAAKHCVRVAEGDAAKARDFLNTQEGMEAFVVEAGEEPAREDPKDTISARTSNVQKAFNFALVSMFIPCLGPIAVWYFVTALFEGPSSLGQWKLWVAGVIGLLLSGLDIAFLWALVTETDKAWFYWF